MCLSGFCLQFRSEPPILQIPRQPQVRFSRNRPQPESKLLRKAACVSISTYSPKRVGAIARLKFSHFSTRVKFRTLDFVAQSLPFPTVSTHAAFRENCVTGQMLHWPAAVDIR